MYSFKLLVFPPLLFSFNLIIKKKISLSYRIFTYSHPRNPSWYPSPEPPGPPGGGLPPDHRQPAHHDPGQRVLSGLQPPAGLFHGGGHAPAPGCQTPSREDAAAAGRQPQVPLPSGCSQHHPAQATGGEKSQVAPGHPQPEQTLRHHGRSVQSHEAAQL